MIIVGKGCAQSSRRRSVDSTSTGVDLLFDPLWSCGRRVGLFDRSKWRKFDAYPDSGEVVPVEGLGAGPADAAAADAPADAAQACRVARLPLLLPELADVDLAELLVQIDVSPEAVAVVGRRLLEGHLGNDTSRFTEEFFERREEVTH